jgi:hypothetical protein
MDLYAATVTPAEDQRRLGSKCHTIAKNYGHNGESDWSQLESIGFLKNIVGCVSGSVFATFGRSTDIMKFLRGRPSAS